MDPSGPTDATFSGTFKGELSALTVHAHHTITLTLDTASGAESIWVYDAAEIDGGMTFKPTAAAPVKVRASARP